MSTKLRYSSPEDVFIKKGENISDVKLNEAFNKLLVNDKTLSPLNSIEPKIWECKWYNNSNIQGYSKGYAVWYNTEGIDDILQRKIDEIYDYGKKNTKISMKIKEYDPFDKECYELYKSILTGYHDEDSGETFQPLFDIGNLSDSVQIYVLQKDNQKISPKEDLLRPEEDRVWKPFFKSSSSIVKELLEKYSSQILNEHIEQYHLGKYALKPESGFVQGYLKNDFSNVDPDSIQVLNSHSSKRSTQGFDFVKRYVRDYVSSDISFTKSEDVNVYYAEISAGTIHYTLSTNSEFEPSTETLKTKLTGFNNYSDIEAFINKLDKYNQVFGNIYFQIVSNSIVSSKYPYRVKYSEIEKISDMKNRYNVVYEVFDRTKNSTTIITDEPYVTEDMISGYYEGYDISNMIDKVPDNFKLNETAVSSYTKTTEITGYTIEEPTKWFKLWNSGYLEHGGIVTFPESEDSIVSVFLDWKYNGTTAPVYDYDSDVEESFYGMYTEYSDAVTPFNQDGCIDSSNRYVVAITPVGDIDNDMATTEVTMMRNNGFCLKLGNAKTKNRTFRYYVSGFVETRRS